MSAHLCPICGLPVHPILLKLKTFDGADRDFWAVKCDTCRVAARRVAAEDAVKELGQAWRRQQLRMNARR